MSDLKLQGEVSMDASSANAALDGVGQSAAKMASKVTSEADKAGQAVDGIGARASGSAEQFTRAESRIRDSIKRSTEQLQMLGKTASQQLEFKIETKGLDAAKFAPYLEELRRVEAAQKSLGASTPLTFKSAFSSVSSSVDGAKASIVGFTSALAGGLVAGLSISAFKSIVFGAVESSAKLNDLSIQTGATVEALSALGSVGKYSEVSTEQIGNAMNKLAKNMAGATEESKGTGKAIEAIGINFREFARLSPEDQMTAVAKAMDGFQDGAGKSAVAMALFGKEGAKMLPFFKDLADVSALNAKITTEQAKAADDFADNLTRLSATGSAWKKELAVGMIPTLNMGLQAFINASNGAGGMREEVRKLSQDGSIKSWTESAITGLTYVIDAFAGVKRVVFTVGESIGGIAAIIADSFGTVGEVVGKALRGDFAGALKANEEAGKRQKSMWIDLKQSVDKAWTDKTLGQVMREQMAQIAAVGDAAQKAKPKLDFTNVLEKDAAAAKKLGEIKADAWATDVAKSYVQVMDELEKVQQSAAASADGLSKSQAALRKVMSSPEFGAYSRQQREQVIYAASLAQASEDRADALKKEAAAAKEAADASLKNSEAIYKSYEDAEKNLKAKREENAAIGLTTVELAALEAAREREAASALEAKATVYELIGGHEDEVDAIRKTAAALRDLASERVTGAAAKQSSEEWKSFWSELDGTAKRVWTDIWHGGQDAFTKVRDTLKALLLDLTYMMAKKWVIGIAASVVGGTASATGGTASSLGGVGNLLSTGNSLYSAYTGQAGATVQGALTYGSEALGLTGAGSAGVMAASEAASAASIAAGASAAEAAAAAGTAAATAAAGSAALMSTLATVAPYLAAAVALYAAFGGSGSKPSIEGGYATAGGPTGSANGKDYVNGAYGGLIDTSAKKVVDDLQASYSATVKALGAKAGTLTAQSFIGYNQGTSGSPNALHLDAQLNGQWLYNRWTDNGGSLAAGTTTAEMEAAVSLSTKKIVIEALKATDLGTALNNYLDTVVTQGKSLAEVDATLGDLGNFVAFRDSIKALPFDYLTNASVLATKALIESAGGLDKFQGSIGNYVNLFYSQTDKTAFATKALGNAFGALGVTMPAIDKSTRDWYKSQVALAGAQDLSIKANADQYNSLLGLASAVDSLAPAVEAAATATEAATDTLRTTVLDNLKATTSSISSILKDGMLGKISKDDLGGQLADAIGNGLQDAMAQTVADQIATAFTDSIITPIIDAVLQGAAISSAVSQSTIDGVIASATARMQSLDALLSDSRFQALLGNIRSSLGGSASASSNSGAAQGNNGSVFGGSATQGSATATAVAAALTYAQQHAAVDAYNAFARANPVESTSAGGRVTYRQQQAFHLNGDDAASQLKSLQDELDKLTPSLQTETARRAAERYVVDDSNLALYDRVRILKDEAAAADLAKTALAGKKTWQDKLDVLNGTTTDAALAQAADLATVTAHQAEAQAQLVYVTDAAARAALEQAIATDEATKAIISQVYAQQEAAKAAAAAAQTAATRSGWQDKLDVLMGVKTDRSVQMARELAGTTDATTQALIRQYYAQLDLADAATAAAKAAEEAVAAQAAAVQAAKDASTAATDAALAGVQRAVDAQKKIAQVQLDVAKESVGNLTTIFNTLKSNISDLYGSVSSTAGMSAARGQDFIAQALATAKSTGYMPDAADLADAIAGARKGLDSAAYATKFEADRARLVLAGQLDALKGIDDTALTAAQSAEKAAQEQIEALDAILTNAQAQVDALRGIDTSVLSVQAAIDRLAAAILAEKTVTATSTGVLTAGEYIPPSGSDQVQMLYAQMLGRTADAAGLAYWTNQLSTGAVNSSSLRVAFATGAAGAGELTASVIDQLHAAGIPGYAVGTPYVPQDGLAYLHEGEAVIPAKFNNIGSAPSSARDGALVAEIRGLREENQAQARAMVQMQTRLTKLMERWDGSGMPDTRVEV